MGQGDLILYKISIAAYSYYASSFLSLLSAIWIAEDLYL
jgi:hypothetical protein